LVALFHGRVLRFYYSEGSLLGIPVPRYCWDIPAGLTTVQEDMILRAGFVSEAVAGAVLLCVSWGWGLAYLAGYALHRGLYVHYGGNPKEIGR
jgi:hypothetical protein